MRNFNLFVLLNAPSLLACARSVLSYLLIVGGSGFYGVLLLEIVYSSRRLTVRSCAVSKRILNEEIVAYNIPALRFCDNNRGSVVRGALCLVCVLPTCIILGDLLRIDNIVNCGIWRWLFIWWSMELKLELELIQTQMAQKPMLRAEVYAQVKIVERIVCRGQEA